MITIKDDQGNIKHEFPEGFGASLLKSQVGKVLRIHGPDPQHAFLGEVLMKEGWAWYKS